MLPLPIIVFIVFFINQFIVLSIKKAVVRTHANQFACLSDQQCEAQLYPVNYHRSLTESNNIKT